MDNGKKFEDIDFGSRLEYFRRKDKYGEPESNEAMAQRLGISGSSLGKQFNTKNPQPRLPTVRNLAKALLKEHSPDEVLWLIVGDGPPPSKAQTMRPGGDGDTASLQNRKRGAISGD